MATAINEKLNSLKEKVALFAEKELACRQDLHSMDRFPFEIWRKMGQENFLGMNLPVSYGGLGENYLAMTITGETLVAQGHNMGLALSWLIHLAVARFLILGFGNKSQQDEFLPRLAKGQITASIAVSEPEMGSHPKHLKTTGLSYGNDYYILNGEKAYLTNGPIADLFVVLALTGDDGVKKRFTAFLVPRDTPGLTVTNRMELGFLQPSPHGGIKLKNCTVPASNILGKKGTAYECMSKPFRDLEDVLLMGPIVGGITWQLELLLDLIRKQSISSTNELKEYLGKFQSMTHCLRILAYEAAAMLDSQKKHPEFISILLSFRVLSQDAQSFLKRFIVKWGIKGNIDLDRITDDLCRTIEIAKNVARIKQKKLGECLI